MSNTEDHTAEPTSIDPNSLSDDDLYNLLKERFEGSKSASIERRIELTQEAILLIVKRDSYDF